MLFTEPTWGDAARIIEIVKALNPGNSSVLMAALAGGLNGPKHCQIVRNACAHKNHQTRAAVRGLAPSYIAAPIQSPVDVLSWRDPASNDFAFVSWLDDMRLISELAVA